MGGRDRIKKTAESCSGIQCLPALQGSESPSPFLCWLSFSYALLLILSYRATSMSVTSLLLTPFLSYIIFPFWYSTLFVFFSPFILALSFILLFSHTAIETNEYTLLSYIILINLNNYNVVYGAYTRFLRYFLKLGYWFVCILILLLRFFHSFVLPHIPYVL